MIWWVWAVQIGSKEANRLLLCGLPMAVCVGLCGFVGTCDWCAKWLRTLHSLQLRSLIFYSSGNRTSVASSTDTGDDHDTDIDDPTPLPPPRPRRWAKKAKEQSMAPDNNTSSSSKVVEEQAKTDDPPSPSDWSRSVPQFPLPTFKPTMQSK